MTYSDFINSLERPLCLPGRRWRRGFAQFLIQHLNRATQAEERMAQIRRLGFKLGEFALADLEFGFEFYKTLLKLFSHSIRFPLQAALSIRISVCNSAICNCCCLMASISGAIKPW